MAETEQSYVVHLRPEGGRRRVAGTSFEDAAAAYLEACHPPAGGDGEVSLIVRDEASGCEQCFRIELATGRTESCD